MERMKKPGELAPTSCVPPKYQSMFPYENFNAMQTVVKDEMLNSDKNCVICAPTGSGKTVVLELAVIRTLECIPNRRKPSVVYLGPLKSLCQERFDDWKKKSEKVGFACNQLTGDYDDAVSSEIEVLNSSDLLCSTPEKFDWLLRRYRHLFEHVRCMLVDEVHTISDETRGSTLEALITRMKAFQSEKGVPPPRFVAVSATIPNVADLGKWLGEDHRVFFFGDEFRACPIEKVVLGFNGYNAFAMDRALNDHLPRIVQQYSDNKPTLVFCMSRKSTEQSAHAIAAMCRPTQDPQVDAAASKLLERQLAQLVLRGVAFHHAGLGQPDRHIIETLFIAGKIFVLCSTSTLAIGVNLPAHLVVIKGTQFCTGFQGAPEELSDTTFLQMIGRAGRPQFDTHGRAVVLTRYDTEYRYRDLLASGTQIESHLHRRLGEQLNAELNLKSINSVVSAINWVKQTFLYVRIAQNPQHYKYNRQNTVDSFLSQQVIQAIEEMKKYDLITYTPNGAPELKPTGYGRLMARQCMSLETMKLIMEKSALKNIDMSSLLDLVAKSSDLANTVLRNDEDSELFKLNREVKFPVKGVGDKEAKISVLLQAAIGCLKIENPIYETEARRYLRVAYRVASCFLDTIHMRGCPSFEMLLNASLFYRAMRTEIWYDSQFLSKQIRGIGMVYSAKLVEAGFTTFEKLASATERQLEDVCDRHPPFGKQVKREASSVPKYSLELSQVPSNEVGGARVLVKVKLLNAAQIAEHSIRGYLTANKLIVMVGKMQGNTLFDYWRLDDKKLVSSNGEWQREVTVTKSPICAKLLSLDIVGCDVTADDFKVRIKRGAKKGSKTAATDDYEPRSKIGPLSPRNNSPLETVIGTIGTKTVGNGHQVEYWLADESEDEEELLAKNSAHYGVDPPPAPDGKVFLKHSIESILAI